MSGPEHYREAERLLSKKAGTAVSGAHAVFEASATDIALAQVHATLALTAATVDVEGVKFGDDDEPTWTTVTS